MIPAKPVTRTHKHTQNSEASSQKLDLIFQAGMKKSNMQYKNVCVMTVQSASEVQSGLAETTASVVSLASSISTSY